MRRAMRRTPAAIVPSSAMRRAMKIATLQISVAKATFSAVRARSPPRRRAARDFDRLGGAATIAASTAARSPLPSWRSISARMSAAICNADGGGRHAFLEPPSDGRAQIREIRRELPAARIHQEERAELFEHLVAIAKPPDETPDRPVLAQRALPLRTRRRFMSRRISCAALWPGAPVTPPPGCVPAPHI